MQGDEMRMGDAEGRRRAFLWPLVVFVVGYGLQAAWPLGCLHPGIWEDVAIAAGLRPPGNPFPGLYRLFVSGLFKCFPPDVVLSLLPYLGRVAMASSAVCVYSIVWRVQPTLVRLQPHTHRFWKRICHVVGMIAALLFLCTEPVWRAGWTFSPTSLLILLCCLAGMFFSRFVWVGSVRSLYVCYALLGVISAETTLGVLLAVLATVGVLVIAGLAGDPFRPFVNPLMEALMRIVVFRRLSYVWVGCFALGIAANAAQFLLTEGVAATGHAGVLGLLFEYVRIAWEETRAAASGSGWLFGFLLGVAPFVVVLRLWARAWDDDHFLPWSVGVCASVAGGVALSQLAGLPVFWFWTWLDEVKGGMIPCDLLLTFFLFFDVVTLAFVLEVLGVDAYCRNYRSIAQRQFPDAMLSEASSRMMESLRRNRTLRLWLFAGIVLLVPCLVVPGRLQTTARAMSRLIEESVRETLVEAKGCRTIFTDGSFDTLLELKAFASGHPLLALQLTAPGTPRARMLRLRAARTAEDRALLENDAALALRSWIETDSPSLKTSAVQIGFELWHREGMEEPTYLGMTALPGGVDAAERKRSLAACENLGNRAEELSSKGKRNDADKSDVEQVTDTLLRKRFPFVLWHLARLAQQRSRVAQGNGERGLAIREAARADMLDRANANVRELKRRMNWFTMQNGQQLTPREGLVIGLTRADFAFAGRYAEPILATDPYDPRANFALGMMYSQEEQYIRAEEHLLRCLGRRPDEPAVLNNLALVQMHLGNYVDALKHINKAIEKHPNLAELGRTREAILKVRDNVKKN